MNTAYPLLDEKKYRCCCFHVEKGAGVIAVVGIVLQLFVLFPYSQWGRPFSWLNVLATLISVLVYASILIAQRKREPRLYLPFLILNGIGILVLAVYSLILLMVLVLSGADDGSGYYEAEVVTAGSEDSTTMPVITHKWHAGHQMSHIRREIFGLLLVLWASAVISTFFQWVVYRAWKWMKLEKGSDGMMSTRYTVGGFPPQTTTGVNRDQVGAGGIENVGFDPNYKQPATISPENNV